MRGRSLLESKLHADRPEQDGLDEVVRNGKVVCDAELGHGARPASPHRADRGPSSDAAPSAAAVARFEREAAPGPIGPRREAIRKERGERLGVLEPFRLEDLDERREGAVDEAEGFGLAGGIGYLYLEPM